MNIYKVGMGSTAANIKAPSAIAAVVFFGAYLIDTNNPFAVVVYEKDGEVFSSDMWWFNLLPDMEHVEMVLGKVNIEDVNSCEMAQDD